MNDAHRRELRCRQCGYRRSIGWADMVEHLRNVGMFKRQKDPDASLVTALFAEQIPLLPCPDCGASGYEEQPEEEFDDAEWGGIRCCEKCQKAIPPERLEVFPDTRRCTQCQQAADQGESDAPPEYCPRCGAVMAIRQRSVGITRYVMHCGDCGYSEG